MFSKAKATVALVAALALPGCGKDLGQFTGAWTTNATTTITCPGVQVPTTTGMSTATFSEGVDADLVSAEDGCVIKFDVTGSVAAVRPISSAPRSLRLERTSSRSRAATLP